MTFPRQTIQPTIRSPEVLRPDERCLEIEESDVLNSLQRQQSGKALALDHIPDTVFGKKTVAKYINTLQEKPASRHQVTSLMYKILERTLLTTITR